MVFREDGSTAAVSAPYLVGIAGPSGSGKSAFAHALASRLPGSSPVVALDSYYRDLSAVPPEERARTNFDVPGALDETLLIDQMGALARGLPIEKPMYDFAAHVRREKTDRVEPGPFVVVEGLFTFCWPALRDLCATKVFLAVDVDTCLARREARDVVERGRTPESVRRQFQDVAWPMYERFVRPTRAYADLILDGGAPLDTLCGAVLDHLEKRGVIAQ